MVRDGTSCVWHTPALRASILALAAVGTFAMTFPVSVPIFVLESFDAGP